MPLPSFFKRQPPASADARPSVAAEGEDSPEVQDARVRARRRLIGAVVLLGVGIVVFPLLFETAPRPIPVDIPIEIPRKDGAAPLSPPPAVSLPRASGAMLTELPSDAGTEVPPASAAASVLPSGGPPSAASAVATGASAPAKAAARASAPARAEDGARAKALLDGAVPAAGAAPAAASASGSAARFVVQVGAYTDATTLREARQKVEKLGLKTYTQVIETDAGKRTRVRVGPFVTREEADAAARGLKGAGLPANILAL